MTKKDFQLIAQTIRDLALAGPNVNAGTRQDIATQFADALASTNPLFKRDLFIQAATGVVPVNARKAKEN